MSKIGSGLLFMFFSHYCVKDYPFVFTNGVQGRLLEVDPDTGFVKLLKM